MRLSRRVGLGLVLSSLLLASCGGSPAAPLVLGDPSINISVPLNVAGCDGQGTCFALGTTGLDIEPTAAAQFSSHGSNWSALGTPAAPSTQLDAWGCWSNACLFGGSNAAGDVLWSVTTSSVVAQNVPSGGLGVAALSCFVDQECALLDVNASGVTRLSNTSNAGATWSTPRHVQWSANTTPESVACTKFAACVVGGTTRSGGNDVATWAVTADAGATWTSYEDAQWTQLIDLYCASQHCLALATASSGRNVIVRSSDGGATWKVTKNQPPRSPGSFACSSLTHCISVGSASVSLSVMSKDSWSAERLKYVPDPFASVGCGVKRCVAIDSQTTVVQSN